MLPSGYQGLRAIGRLSVNPCRAVYRLAEGDQKRNGPRRLVLRPWVEARCRRGSLGRVIINDSQMLTWTRRPTSGNGGKADMARTCQYARL